MTRHNDIRIAFESFQLSKTHKKFDLIKKKITLKSNIAPSAIILNNKGKHE